MTGRIIHFAIAGFGHIGKRHAEMISNNPACRLACICDTDPKEELTKGLNGVPFFYSMEEMLALVPDIDVVCIATPNGLHEQHALTALRSQKHVVIEKPMCLTKSGCEHIISEATRQQRLVFCVMQNRYSPPSLWLKDIVTSNLLGSIYMVQVNCFWNRDERYYKNENWHGKTMLDGGTLFTQFSHFIDMIYWLFGDITNIRSRLYDFNHQKLTEFEDSGIISFEFVKGGTGSINFSTAVWDKNLESSITIIGEHGTVKVGGQYMNEVQYCNIKNYDMPVLKPVNPANDYGEYKGSAANHHFIFANVVDVLNGTMPISTNAQEGMKVVEMIERIYAAGKPGTI